MQNGWLNHSRNGTNSEWAASHFSSLQKVILHAHKRGTQIIVKKKNQQQLFTEYTNDDCTEKIPFRKRKVRRREYIRTYISLPILRFILPDKLTRQL